MTKLSIFSNEYCSLCVYNFNFCNNITCNIIAYKFGGRLRENNYPLSKHLEIIIVGIY